MVSRARAQRDGPGELVDVSMLETLVLCLTYYPVTYADMVGRPFRQRAVHRHARGGGDERRPRRRRRRDRPAVARLLRDGRPPRVDGGPQALRQPRPPAAGHRGVDGGAHDRRGPRARRRVPHPARADRQRRDDPGDRPLPGPRVDRPEPPRRLRRARPALPVRPAPAPRPRAGASAGRARRHRRDARDREPATRRGRDGGRGCRSTGLRVLDLTAFWAGPLCTHVLAMLGAEVLHVESTARPDGTRLLAGMRFSEPDWWEQSGIFSGLNTDKKSVTLDLGTDRGRELLRELLATCDVARRELHAAGARADRARRRRRPRRPARPRRRPHARLRARRTVARRPGLRLRHRGRLRADVDDRAPGPEPGLAVLRGRLERRHPRAVRPAPRAGAPPAHRRGRPRRGGDGRRRAQRRRGAGRRALGLRRAPRARREPRADRRAAEPLPHRRHRRRGRARRLGGDRGGRRRAVARASATRSVGPAWAMDPALSTAAGTAAAARHHRPPPVELVRRAERRRDRRLPLGRGRPGRAR